MTERELEQMKIEIRDCLDELEYHKHCIDESTDDDERKYHEDFMTSTQGGLNALETFCRLVGYQVITDKENNVTIREIES